MNMMKKRHGVDQGGLHLPRGELVLLSQISQMLTSISRINEPIPGMFESISHGYSKYDQEIKKFQKLWKFCDIFDLSSAHACRVEKV